VAWLLSAAAVAGYQQIFVNTVSTSFGTNRVPATTNGIKVMTSRTKSEDAKPEAGKKEAAGCCRRIGTLQLFVLNISALLLFLMIGTIYTAGVIRTIERRFGLRSSQSGFLFSCNDITHTTLVLFIGYFGRRAHKSRIISVTAGFSAAAFVLMASPHWLFDSSSPAASATVGGRNESLPGDRLLTRVSLTPIYISEPWREALSVMKMMYRAKDLLG
jgi:hypothetical protein